MIVVGVSTWYSLTCSNTTCLDVASRRSAYLLRKGVPQCWLNTNYGKPFSLSEVDYWMYSSSCSVERADGILLHISATIEYLRRYVSLDCKNVYVILLSVTA